MSYPLLAIALAVAMGRRGSAKTARKKEAKRQRAAEKRSQRYKPFPPTKSSPEAAGHRLSLLREAVARGETPTPRGMLNLGNTCFFNAVMQNIARITAIRDYFLGAAPTPAEGPVTAAVRAFIIAMWDLKNSSSLDPSALFTQVGKANPIFSGRAQQDSHEIMRVIFALVIEEEKKRLTDLAKGLFLPLEVDCDPAIDVSDFAPPPRLPEDFFENTRTSDPIPGLIANQDAMWDKQYAIASVADPGIGENSDTASVPATASSLHPPVIDFVDECEVLPDYVSPVALHVVTESHLPKEIPKEKSDGGHPYENLVTIVEKTLGGVLSSTIICKECGNKSSVHEPFLDLQLPLVPSEKLDTLENKIVGNTLISCPKAKSSDDMAKLSKNTIAPTGFNEVKKLDIEEQFMKEGKCADQCSFTAPPAQPYRPSPRQISSNIESCHSVNHLCDKVAEDLTESLLEEEVGEHTLVLYNPAVFGSELQNTSTTNNVSEQLDNTDECSGISSLFDTDFGDGTCDDTQLVNIRNISSFSSVQASYEAEKNEVESSDIKKLLSPQAVRRPSSFMTSLLGGIGCKSSTLHAYKSLIGSIEEFTKVEVLEGENSYSCEECTRREKLRVALHRMTAKVEPNTMQESLDLSKDSIILKSRYTNDLGSADIGGGVESSSGITDCTISLPQLGNMVPVTNMPIEESGESQILMSSPVTTSESSSGVSSEDDGELIIEEELEDSLLRQREGLICLNRQQEDELIENLKVDIPTVRTTAEKRLMIRDAPDVLTFQLKRFTQIGYRGGLRKLSGHVACPLNLDLTPFVENEAPKDTRNQDREKESPRQKCEVSKRKTNARKNPQRREQYEYLLTGVCVHGGSLSGGHYMAYVRGVEQDRTGSWYSCNDSRVSMACEEDVLNSEAYLLYYERIQQ